MQSFYDSAWHHPGLAFGFGALFLGWLLRRAPHGTLRLVLGVLAVETLVDAWLTGAWSPVPKSAQQAVGITFVILGDLRLFLLLERFRRPGVTWVAAVPKAAAWALVVPVLQAVAIRLFPDTFEETRRIYLVYEVLFCVLAIALLVTRFHPRATPSRYPAQLLGFFLLQYWLWVASDVLLLAGQSWALGLRLVPNVLYYGLFLWSAARLAPEAAWR